MNYHPMQKFLHFMNSRLYDWIQWKHAWPSANRLVKVKHTLVTLYRCQAFQMHWIPLYIKSHFNRLMLNDLFHKLPRIWLHWISRTLVNYNTNDLDCHLSQVSPLHLNPKQILLFITWVSSLTVKKLKWINEKIINNCWQNLEGIWIGMVNLSKMI